MLTAGPRVVLRAEDRDHDVFDVLEIANGIARVRSAYLFELGEELTVRVEQDGGRAIETVARVRAHVGTPDARVTELELADLASTAPGA